MIDFKIVGEICQCGHKRSEHDDLIDRGHGGCKKCKCSKFTWAGWIKKRIIKCYGEDIIHTIIGDVTIIIQGKNKFYSKRHPIDEQDEKFGFFVAFWRFMKGKRKSRIYNLNHRIAILSRDLKSEVDKLAFAEKKYKETMEIIDKDCKEKK